MELFYNSYYNLGNKYVFSEFVILWILRTIVYHLFQSIVYQRFSAKFTTWQQDWFKYFSPKFTSYG